MGDQLQHRLTALADDIGGAFRVAPVGQVQVPTVGGPLAVKWARNVGPAIRIGLSDTPSREHAAAAIPT